MNDELTGQDAAGTRNTVTVMGVGSVSRMPDSAYFQADIEERGDDVDEVYRAGTAALNRLTEALHNAGAREEEIESSGVSVHKSWEWEQDGDVECKVYYFIASGRATVTVGDSRRAAELAMAAGRAGVESLSAISFAVSDWAGAHLEALRVAAGVARARAEALAEPLGRSVGRALEINTTWEERNGWGTEWGGSFFASVDDELPAPPTPVEHRITGRARVTFELE